MVRWDCFLDFLEKTPFILVNAIPLYWFLSSDKIEHALASGNYMAVSRIGKRLKGSGKEELTSIEPSLNVSLRRRR